MADGIRGPQRHPSLGEKALETSERRKLFAHEYLIDFSAKAAAERAGLSPSSGAQLIRDPMVRQLIDNYLLAREQKTEIKIEQIIQELARLALSDIGQCFDDDEKLLPAKAMPVTVRRAVASVEENERYDREGNVIGVVRKVKLWSKPEAAAILVKLFMETAEAKKKLLEAVDDVELQKKAEQILAAKKRLPPPGP